MNANTSDKASRFQALHQRTQLFLMPNPWDGASTKMLTGLGFEALANSSGACAATLGRKDGRVTRDEALAHCRGIVESTDLPVSADLENGFGDAPDEVAKTIRMAAEVGLVGCSIEDYAGISTGKQYDLTLAVERIVAAVETVRCLPFPFILTARAENFLRNNDDLDDVLKRLEAYQNAGADVLFAPALPNLESVRQVCTTLGKPVNFMVAIPGKSFTIDELTVAGVRRVSFATSLYRSAMAGLLSAAQEIKSAGTFRYLQSALPTKEFHDFLVPQPK